MNQHARHRRTAHADVRSRVDVRAATRRLLEEASASNDRKPTADSAGWILTLHTHGRDYDPIASSAGEHPYEAICGWTAPDDCVAITVAGTWAPHGSIAITVTADGSVASIGADDGLVADGLRRSLRAPVPPPSFLPGLLLGRVWGLTLLDAPTFTARSVAASDPLPAVMSAVAAAHGLSVDWAANLLAGPTVQGDWTTRAAIDVAAGASWSAILRVVADGFSEGVAEWMGVDLRAKVAMLALPSSARIAVALSTRDPVLAEKWAQLLLGREWWDGPRTGGREA